MGEFRWKNAGKARVAHDVKVVIDVLDEGRVNVAGLVPDEVTAIANVVASDVVALHAQGALAGSGVVLDHDAVSVRAMQGVLREDFALAALFGIVARRPRYIFGKPRRGPVINDDFAHLPWHGRASIVVMLLNIDLARCAGSACGCASSGAYASTPRDADGISIRR